MAKAILLKTTPCEGAVSEHEIQLSTPAGKAILCVRGQHRTFKTISFEVEGSPELCLAFSPSGPGVENLDQDSDIAQCFGLSAEIRYNGMRMSAMQMSAFGVEDLVSALGSLKLRVYNPEEI